MQIHPLPAALHSLLVNSGVESFELNFDRRLGDLDVSIYNNNPTTLRVPLEKAIERWADVYDYNFDLSGDTGDVVAYDLTNGQVEHKEWYMKRHYDEITHTKLQLES